MIKRINQIIKNIKYHKGRYMTTDGMMNNVGESLDELFARRDREIKERITASYPTMAYEDYMKLPTRDQDLGGKCYRMSALPYPKNKIGGVFYSKESRIVLYRLVKKKIQS